MGKGNCMKNIIEKLKAEVQADPARFCSDSSVPILDTLYWHYCEDVGIETEGSKAARAAFICGVKLGVQLAMKAKLPLHCIDKTLFG